MWMHFKRTSSQAVITPQMTDFCTSCAILFFIFGVFVRAVYSIHGVLGHSFGVCWILNPNQTASRTFSHLVPESILTCL